MDAEDKIALDAFVDDDTDLAYIWLNCKGCGFSTTIVTEMSFAELRILVTDHISTCGGK